MLVMVHTPHRDKKRGTTRSMDVAIEHGIDAGRVVIDHNNEETVQEVLDRGFWAAFTIYPHTKMGNERMVEIARRYGSERIFIDSSSDWGVSDPLAVPKTARLMLERGIARADVEAICYGNALRPTARAGRCKEDDWLNPPAIDQRMLFEGNSVLRGQQPRVDELPQHSRGQQETSCSSKRVKRVKAAPCPSGTGEGEGRRQSRVTPSPPHRELANGQEHETTKRNDHARSRAAAVSAVYQQRFTVQYDYPVYFTERLFAHDNPVFCDALVAQGAEQAASLRRLRRRQRRRQRPDLAHDIAAYAQHYAQKLELVAHPETGARRRAGQERPAAASTRLQRRLLDLGIDRHSYVVAIGGGAVLDMIGFVAATDASRRAPRPRADHGAGAERLRRRREERRQRLRREELPRHLRAAVRGAQRRRASCARCSRATGSPAWPRRSRSR